MMLSASDLMLVCGTAVFLFTFYWVHTRHLREKYAFLWILMASCILLTGFFPKQLMRFAEHFRLSYPAAVLFLALGILYLFCISVSTSLSRRYRAAVRIAQEHALFELRLREHQHLIGSLLKAASRSASRDLFDSSLEEREIDPLKPLFPELNFTAPNRKDEMIANSDNTRSP